jgi:16S rRNA (cytosine967-C5)-methyltransferase
MTIKKSSTRDGNQSTPAASGKQARLTALQIVYEVFEKGQYANLALERTLRKSTLAWVDRHLVTEIVNGSVRMVRHLDWVLDLFLAKPVAKQQPWVRNILRISLYQLLFMDRIPDYACVDDAVKMANLKAGKRLGAVVNGVLRNYLRSREKIQIPAEDELQYLAVKYSYPDWLVREFLSLTDSAEVEGALIYLNSPPKVAARSNLLRIGREDLLDRLKQEGVRAEAGSYTPWSVHIRDLKQPVIELDSYKQGLFYLQNEGSMLAAALLEPPPGGLVYDLGAGVGGKSTHVAEMTGDRGRVIAVERHSHKLELLKANCRRLGINHVTPLQSDILQLEPDLPQAERVLLDAPCSGWGVLNRRADARWRLSQEEVKDLPQLQFRLLQAAAGLLKPDGLLLYSTCTFNPAENEQVVARFLKEAPFAVQGFAEKISFFPLTAEDIEAARRGCLTLRPGRYQCDGMFYALLRRLGHE